MQTTARAAIGIVAAWFGLSVVATWAVLPASAHAAVASAAPAKCKPASSKPPKSRNLGSKQFGAGRNVAVTSFDGTQLVVHDFPRRGIKKGQTAPTVLMGPGWGGGGDTDTTRGSTIDRLRSHGYNVVTWDPRGWGKSGGTVEVNSPQYEGRDMQELISWVAAQPESQLDATGDPRLGMVGVSYGGGIQLTTAALDCRVDAIVPSWAWHSLQTSLDKADTPKIGWATLLYEAAIGRPLDQHILGAISSATATGTISADEQAWFASRGPGGAVGKIRVPTYIVQGTVDTLFTLDEGITNYGVLRKHGVPVKMSWACVGHGACLTRAGDPAHIDSETLAWLDRYVKRNTSVKTGPRFETVDQDGKRYTAGDYPVPSGGAPLTAKGSGTLALVPTGGAGPAVAPRGKDLGPAGGVVLGITPAPATNAVNVKVHGPKKTAVVIGAPKLTFTYSGTPGSGDRPTRVFAQLVDDKTGLVLGNQITPIAVTLDGQRHTVSVPLEAVVYTARRGSAVTLQLVADTVAYAQPQSGGSITFDTIDVALPVGKVTAAK